MRLVISGASGFVGANLVQHILNDSLFLDRFDKVLMLDILQYGEQKISLEVLQHEKFEFAKESIYSESTIERRISEGDVLIHLAVEENTFTNPQDDSLVDIEGYVRKIAEKNLSQLIFLSTADVYGVNNSNDIGETDVVKPTIFYAAAKVTFEAYLQANFALFGLPVVIFRPVTIYGPNQYAGWLIPRVITQALDDQVIKITGDGLVKRDWIFVDDICRVIMKAVGSNKSKAFGEVFNLGTGKEQTVLGATQYILEKLGKPQSLIEFIPDRPGDIPRQVTSAAKAKAFFEWRPAMQFHEGIDVTIDWYLKARAAGKS